MAERRGMGRGLGAILPESTSGLDMRELPIELVKPNPGQPRSRFDEAALQALSESIKASGVVQPLIVRSLSDGSYEIIAGERRWRAAHLAGVEKVPVVIRDSDEADQLCGKYKSRTRNVAHVCRYCHCPMDKADKYSKNWPYKTQQEITDLV